MSSPSETLLASLQDLSAAAQFLKRESAEPFNAYREPIKRLAASWKEIAEGLERIGPPRQLPPADAYIRQWDAFLRGEQQSLERRVVRRLCWEPLVVTSKEFQEAVDSIGQPLGSRAIEGMVRSCHAKWDDLPRGVRACVQRRLERCEAPNNVLRLWQQHPQTVIGEDGAERLGHEMVQRGVAIDDFCSSWGVDKTSVYVVQAAQAAGEAALSHGRGRQLNRGFIVQRLLPWSGWPSNAFRRLVSDAILRVVEIQDEVLQQALVDCVLKDSRLGDPRLQQNRTNWAGTDQKARNAFIQWQSKEDITFFFEHVLPRNADPHGRKRFWLQYVSALRMSRPFLSADDRARLNAEIRRRPGGGHVGRMEGQTSAFILDFGPVVVAEFSKVGNACYLYRRENFSKVIDDLWTNQGLWETHLKRRSLCIDDPVRHTRGWEDKIAHVLSRYGIGRE